MTPFLMATLLLFANGATAQNMRLVTLSPALTEIAFAIGLENEIVGVSQFSDFPARALSKTPMGPYTKPLYEKIIALQPSLVLISQEGPRDVADQLERFKIRYEVIRMRELEDIPIAIEKIGGLTHKTAEAAKVRDEFQRRLSALRSRAHHKNRGKRVIIQLDQQPVIVAASKTFLNQIVEICGAKNVFSHLDGYPKIPLETLVQQKADVILVISHLRDDEKEKKETEKFWGHLKQFQKSAVRFVDPDTASRPGPRLMEGAEKICHDLDS